jgi:hypothetical protein
MVFPGYRGEQTELGFDGSSAGTGECLHRAFWKVVIKNV